MLFVESLRSFFRKKAGQSPAVVEPIRSDENLSRFSRQKYAPTQRFRAFLTNNDELSVLRHQKRSESEIWQWGDENVGQGTVNVPVRYQFIAQVLAQYRLQAIADDTPPGHANIVGWPAEKEKRKEIALKLADPNNPWIVPVDRPT